MDQNLSAPTDNHDDYTGRHRRTADEPNRAPDGYVARHAVHITMIQPPSPFVWLDNGGSR